MPVPGTKPTDGPKRFRGAPQIEWTEVEDEPFTGPVPVKLPSTRTVDTRDGPTSVPVLAATKNWWKAVRRMPHCVLWSESDWHFALATALVADTAFRGVTTAAAELRQREKILGTTMDARRDLRIRYVRPGEGDDATEDLEAPPRKGRKGGTVTSLEDRRQRLSSGDAS